LPRRHVPNVKDLLSDLTALESANQEWRPTSHRHKLFHVEQFVSMPSKPIVPRGTIHMVTETNLRTIASLPSVSVQEACSGDAGQLFHVEQFCPKRQQPNSIEVRLL